MNRTFLDITASLPLLPTILRRRAASYYPQFAPFLKKTDRILDVGCGPCYFAESLVQHQHQVVPIDVTYSPFLTHIPRILYDGDHMPFENDTFDWALIITVLHHTYDPAAVIAESARVAKKLIIVEDVIWSEWHKYLTWGLDNLYNLEFFTNPHNNRTEAGWREMFGELGLSVIDVKRQWTSGLTWQKTSFGPIWSHIYFLERMNRPS
ncbi:MAG: class I SAM-dependent methyltransferase [Chloroflexota bacterium]